MLSSCQPGIGELPGFGISMRRSAGIQSRPPLRQRLEKKRAPPAVHGLQVGSQTEGFPELFNLTDQQVRKRRKLLHTSILAADSSSQVSKLLWRTGQARPVSELVAQIRCARTRWGVMPLFQSAAGVDATPGVAVNIHVVAVGEVLPAAEWLVTPASSIPSLCGGIEVDVPPRPSPVKRSKIPVLFHRAEAGVRQDRMPVMEAFRRRRRCRSARRHRARRLLSRGKKFFMEMDPFWSMLLPL